MLKKWRMKKKRLKDEEDEEDEGEEGRITEESTSF